MLKITAVVTLVLIVTWSHAVSRRQKKDGAAGSEFESVGALWASGLSCDSCGRECASACGTRHFRACCFNYLRRKRGNRLTEDLKTWSLKQHEDKSNKKYPMTIESTPEFSFLTPVFATNDLEPNVLDTVDNRYQLFYDA